MYTLQKVWDSIREQVDTNKEYFDVDFIIGMSRGGLIPAVMVATYLNKPLVSIYINKQDEIFFDRASWIEGKHVMVIDDICRSGVTLGRVNEHLLTHTKPASIRYFTAYSVPSLRRNPLPFVLKSVDLEEDIKFPWDHDR